MLVYELDSKDAAFAEIREIFEDYHYNIDFKSLIPGRNTDGEGINLTFSESKDDGTVTVRKIAIQESGYIEIDGKEFRCKKAEELLKEIDEILADLDPVE